MMRAGLIRGSLSERRMAFGSVRSFPGVVRSYGDSVIGFRSQDSEFSFSVVPSVGRDFDSCLQGDDMSRLGGLRRWSL